VPEWYRIIAIAGAFGVAVSVHASSTVAARSRFVLGLHAGALFSFVGLELIHHPTPLDPLRLLRLEGASLLFLPLGILFVAPWREALAALPLALAVARLGCLPYDCCYAKPWNAPPELAGFVALHFAARRWPEHTTPIVLSGFGAIRLLSLPLRATPAVEPFIDPAWIALAWIAAGVLLRHRIGSAESAREWFTERTEPLLRALILMLVVWLLFPLGAELFADPSRALLVASLAALALMVGLRQPVLPRISIASACVFGASLLAGAAISTIAGAGLGLAAVGGGPATSMVLVAIAPVFEELLYRERLLGAVRFLWGGKWALFLSSALFALGHMDTRAMPIAFVGGLACGAVMLRTGSLAAVIGLHAGWNLGVVLAS
jgi:membrane protease YdiL (CAAX protease family)